MCMYMCMYIEAIEAIIEAIEAIEATFLLCEPCMHAYTSEADRRRARDEKHSVGRGEGGGDSGMHVLILWSSGALRASQPYRRLPQLPLISWTEAGKAEAEAGCCTASNGFRPDDRHSADAL